MKVFGEALMLGERAGLALDPLLDVLATSSAGIPNIVERYDGIRGRSNRKVAVNTVLSFLELANASFGDDFAAAPVCDASLAALRDVSRAGFGSEDLIGIGRKGC
jgi:3-hydroxyisobutyrate dehydrogenase-like beta-hydroxyacid dehydrogenase